MLWVYTNIINILFFRGSGSTLDFRIWRHGRQILTSKVVPRAEAVNWEVSCYCCLALREIICLPFTDAPDHRTMVDWGRTSRGEMFYDCLQNWGSCAEDVVFMWPCRPSQTPEPPARQILNTRRPVLVKCWAIVCNVGPALMKHWLHVLFWLSVLCVKISREISLKMSNTLWILKDIGLFYLYFFSALKSFTNWSCFSVIILSILPHTTPRSTEPTLGAKRKYFLYHVYVLK